MAATNYTLGSGKVLFGKFSSGETPGPFRYLGNTPELALTVEAENLDHINADSGTREVDDSVALSVTRSGTMVCDDIQIDNLALFFFGTKSSQTIAAASDSTETISNPKEDEIYQIGISASDRVGTRNISVDSIVKGSDTLTVDVDYEVDGKNGLITFLKSPAAGDWVVTYDVAAATFDQVVTGGEPISGALRYVEDNPKGEDNFWVFPKVTLRPNGDLALKGTEWRQIPFSLTVEKPSSGAAIYINGTPTT